MQREKAYIPFFWSLSSHVFGTEKMPWHRPSLRSRQPERAWWGCSPSLKGTVSWTTCTTRCWRSTLPGEAQCKTSMLKMAESAIFSNCLSLSDRGFQLSNTSLSSLFPMKRIQKDTVLTYFRCLTRPPWAPGSQTCTLTPECLIHVGQWSALQINAHVAGILGHAQTAKLCVACCPWCLLHLWHTPQRTLRSPKQDCSLPEVLDQAALAASDPSWLPHCRRGQFFAHIQDTSMP